MGDHRADIRLKFEIHDKIYKTEMWINYTPNENGIDRRIVEWFEDCWTDAYRRYQDKMDEQMEESRKEELEKKEKLELKRLKEKYEK